ncbi:MAG TPA: hypothetical protein VEJ46_12170 [Candidatus Acidoferrum sp.]|nr:hypothetical protein [Candidatus Acidoferrum sp.]
MARTDKTEAALRRIVERKAPVKTKLAALAQMREPSAKWLQKIVSAETTHPKIAVRCVEMLRALESSSASPEEVDPRLAAFLRDAETTREEA